MGKFILALLFLFRSLLSLPAGTGSDPTGGYAPDRYMELWEMREERGPVSSEEQVRVLKELGITLSEETVAQIEADGMEFYGGEYWLALMIEGFGDYDYNSGVWTPSSSQVYSFDAEFYDVEGMYQLYLQGLQSISRDELTFGDVTADYRNADLYNNVGTVSVRFTLNGKEFQCKLQYMGDWLDLHIRDAVNSALEELHVEKRFYGTDGDQGEIIFFCTEEWARSFEDATLCYMSLTADY